jgi:hypothetical protein
VRSRENLTSSISACRFVPGLLFLLVLIGCGPQWKPFVSTEGGFGVLAPGTLTHERKNDSPLGIPIDSHTYKLILEWSADEAVGYTVMYSDFPDFLVAASDPSKMLDDAWKGAVKKADDKSYKARDISLDGHPGKEVTHIQSGRMTMDVRLYLVKHRLYQVMAARTPRGASASDVTRFLDSFRLVRK